MWPGFRASAFAYETGITLVIDNVNKFMSTISVLEKINEIRREYPKDKDGTSKFQSKVRELFVGSSIIANWGNKRTYNVDNIDFDKNPVTRWFTNDDGV